MTSGWTDNNWCNVLTKNKLGIVSPVEDKKKLMLRMVRHDSFQRFIGEPTNALKLVFNQ